MWFKIVRTIPGLFMLNKKTRVFYVRQQKKKNNVVLYGGA